MADSLADLGGYDLFPLEPDWSTRPTNNYRLMKDLLKYPGTAMSLNSFIDYVPLSYELGFTFSEEQDMYNMADFFHEKRGRVHAFWFKAPHREMTLYQGALSGATSLYMERNFAHLQYQGHERIYIDMKSEDLLTRKVLSVTDDETNNRMSVAVNTSIDRDLTLTNHWSIGKLIFARFSEDSLIWQFKAAKLAQLSFTVTELVQEYPS